MTTIRAIARPLAIRPHDPPAERALGAVALVFLINGVVLSSWVSRIPAVTARHGLGKGEVGTLLMVIAIGAMLSFAIAGASINRKGSATTAIAFGSLFALALPLIGVAPSVWTLAPVFVLFGAGNGGMDVAMNAQGVEVEQTLGRSVINSLHGYFSLGGVIGAGIGALAAGLDVSPAAHLPVMGLAGLGALWWIRPHMLPDAHLAHSSDEPVFALPPRPVLLVGVVAFCAAITEGATIDWSALYLDDHLGTGGGVAALGFAAFSLAMLVGRFSGDRLVDRFGSVPMVRTGAAMAALGLATGLVIDTPAAMIAAFTVVGLGVSVLFPLVFKAAATFPGVSRGRAVAGVATIGYTGFLVGPPVLGWVAEPTSLRVSLAIVVALAATIGLLAPALGRREQPPAVG